MNKYATGIGFEDDFLWDYNNNKETVLLQQAKALGLIVHIWTFKDDDLLFNARNNIVPSIVYRTCIASLKNNLNLTESSQNSQIFMLLSRRCSCSKKEKRATSKVAQNEYDSFKK